jgi:hypothetical protein
MSREGNCRLFQTARRSAIEGNGFFKHRCRKALWSAYPEELLYGQYALWRLPQAGFVSRKSVTATYEICECIAMNQLGKPDTGNPSVRFDEGSEPKTEN